MCQPKSSVEYKLYKPFRPCKAKIWKFIWASICACKQSSSCDHAKAAGCSYCKMQHTEFIAVPVWQVASMPVCRHQPALMHWTCLQLPLHAHHSPAHPRKASRVTLFLAKRSSQKDCMAKHGAKKSKPLMCCVCSAISHNCARPEPK